MNSEIEHAIDFIESNHPASESDGANDYQRAAYRLCDEVRRLSRDQIKPTLILRFSSNYHMATLGGSAVVARYEIPVSEVRAIYYADTMLTVETIDGKRMKVTSREIEVVIGPCIS